MSQSRPFLWVGNHPATDLCNTTPVIDGHTVDLLDDPDDLAGWLRAAHIDTNIRLDRLPDDDQHAALTYAHSLRDAMRPVLEAAPRSAVLARLNDVLATNSAALNISAHSPRVRLVADSPAAQLRLDLAVAVTAILDHDRRLIRRCANPACVLLFLDSSKSGRRRWCDMTSCGNRAKVAAHYQRHHAPSPTQATRPRPERHTETTSDPRH